MGQRTIFRNANILTGDAHLGLGSVVMKDRFIESAGTAPVEARPGDRVIDLSGRTVMPGLVVSHYHASYWNLGAEHAPFGLEVPIPLQTVRAIRNLGTTLGCGFTSTISAGSPYALDASLKVAIEQGLIEGPRILPCGNDVSTTGHANDSTFPWFWEVGARGSIRHCDGPDEFRKGVRQEVREGAEIIKLFVTAGHLVGGAGEQVEMSMDELAAAVEAAHQRNVLIRGHIANRDTVLAALDLGMDIIDHGDGFDEACIDRIAGTSASLVPSLLFPLALLDVLPDSAGKDGIKADFDQMAEILPAANAAGVRLLLGDDYGGAALEHGRYREELALYVSLGIPALDVIRWGTRYGAEAMRRGDELGTLEPGKLADLLVVDGDPLEDIAICATPDRLLAIVKDGAFVKDELDNLAPVPQGLEASLAS